ncbi:hypothetical protein DSO57_1019722 [Entomophthora muscae]|uniref:Uncharacterized protein n=1 Tax=Entomophthora muscae TaxID=34485 RepID=A0ACC2SGT5_9FUNG|nr:hypothetical protein DSO57_1019722 [Entomophthora muscae]
MTNHSSWSLATIQDTLWGLVDRNPKAPQSSYNLDVKMIPGPGDPNILSPPGSDLDIKALQHLKPNNLNLVPTQEQLIKFISNKCIAANPPPPKASDVFLELTLTHKLKQLPSGERFLLYDNRPATKD